MNEPIFTSAPFYLLRTPIWPIDKLEAILSQENWMEALFHLYESEELLREAICVASPTLYQALQKKQHSFQTAVSLLNYVVRMCTRTIPFGLFSFVAMGSWGKKTNQALHFNEIYKRARPDMEWVYALIKKSDHKSIRTNPLISHKGDRIYLNYLRGEKKESISISATSLVRMILKEAEKTISIPALLEKLQAAIPGLQAEKTMKVIQDLLSNQVLLPAILPSLLSSSPFAVPEEIAEEIAAYNRLPPGKGEEKLTQIQKKMEGIATAKTYLQVDTAHPDTPLELPAIVKEELEKTATLLWKLSAGQKKFPHLSSYHEKFIEKYGTFRTIPLLELFHKEKGLGSYVEKKTSAQTSSKWDKWLNNAWQECLKNQKTEIVLDDRQLVEPDPKLAPCSFELFFKIIANSFEEIDAGEFCLIPTQTTWQGGSSFGRFVDLLGADFEQKLREFYRQEELLDPNAHFVELSYFPSSPRSANVAINPCLRELRLDIESTEDTLTLNDIYVGATSERFYLTLKEGGKEINACIGNLLTVMGAPEPLRFIREVTLAKNHAVYPFSWGSLEETANYLPRVRYQKAILSPAKWKFNGDFTQFTAWADEWNLPERFLWERGDQLLLLDRTHPAHLHEIGTKLKKGEALQFVEYIESKCMRSEMAVSLTKKLAANSYPRPAHLAVPYTTRWKIPSSEWLYIKLYRNEEERERFFLHNLTPFAESLRKEGAIASWFFLYYRDPDHHLRFRLRLSSPESLPNILSSLQQATRHWMEGGLINHMVITGYEREVERYGGPELIDAAEEVFFADSLAVAAPLRASKTHHEAILQTLSLISFLSDLGFDLEESIAFLANGDDDTSELKGFREHKQQLIRLIEDNLFQNEFRKSKSAHFTSLAPPSQLNAIYKSMAHMHCNRLGCNLAAEKRANLYAYHALQQVKRKRNEAPCRAS